MNPVFHPEMPWIFRRPDEYSRRICDIADCPIPTLPAGHLRFYFHLSLHPIVPKLIQKKPEVEAVE